MSFTIFDTCICPLPPTIHSVKETDSNYCKWKIMKDNSILNNKIQWHLQIKNPKISPLYYFVFFYASFNVVWYCINAIVWITPCPLRKKGLMPHCYTFSSKFKEINAKQQITCLFFWAYLFLCFIFSQYYITLLDYIYTKKIPLY